MIGKPGVLVPREDLKLKKISRGLDLQYLLDALFCVQEVGENFCDIEEDR
jgi:hypothetical protein